MACSSPWLAPHSAQRHPNPYPHPFPMTNQHPHDLISPLLHWIGPSLDTSPINLPSRVNSFRGLTQPKSHVPLNRKTVALLFLRNSRLRRQPIYLGNGRARIGKEPHRNRVLLPPSYIRLQTPAAQRRPGSGRKRRRTKLKMTTTFGGCNRFVPTLILRSSTVTSSRLVQGKLPHA